MPLQFGGRPGQAEAKRIFDLLARIGTALEQDALRQHSRRFQQGRFVQCGQRLQGGVGARTARNANLAARGVERREGWIGADPPPEGVEGAPVKLRPLARGPFVHANLGPQKAQLFPQVRDLFGINTRSTDFRIQQATDGQRLVADHFGVHAKPWAASQQPVIGILVQTLIIRRCALAIRGRHDHEFEDVFYIPRSRVWSLKS